MYKYTWLDASQRKDFQDRWWQLFRMVAKWNKPPALGQIHEIFANKKDLEKELIDLEDISLAAYRAMKYLRLHLEASKTRDEELKTPLHKNGPCSACGKSLDGEANYASMYNLFFCDFECATKFEEEYESESYSG